MKLCRDASERSERLRLGVFLGRIPGDALLVCGAWFLGSRRPSQYKQAWLLLLALMGIAQFGGGNWRTLFGR
jgi:hypothetical protein